MQTSAADVRLYEIMTRASRGAVALSSDPYELGVDTMAEIARDVITTAEHGGQAYCLWADLTDIADDPRIADPALCAVRIRVAAAEWLHVDVSDPDAVRAFFSRWRDPIHPATSGSPG